jgi:hypothetical protein
MWNKKCVDYLQVIINKINVSIYKVVTIILLKIIKMKRLKIKWIIKKIIVNFMFI